ncbi:gluconate 2-dehydrogenase subunit 3 family protein [Chitinophaga niabensis]|uniref:Gluconate 2-dehydrogenase subunit 3 n=1 Tax=Chitinophaga niabensis TaxID=536979 RepID=A0A1N6JM16_9BACT|nr:gluconate 2-dehydrogenase subunit 3 family protein [Chitinophaga niabensis]SIO45217.1 Gluconate 2-dehydrogenase subunit 3 [Chitinophaga niabensis]
MDRRESLKALMIGTLSSGVILSACDPKPKEEAKAGAGVLKDYGRQPEEVLRDNALLAEKFFTDAEMKTIAVLVDIIIPKDEHSGSATDAKVPDFIEFIVKDQPKFQTPIRGGLRWLDMHCLKKHNKSFTELAAAEQLGVVDEIAFPERATPFVSQGVAFFSTIRNLTATGFFTSKMGLEDLGYKGNQPNEWDGVPEDVLQQYGLAYDEKMLAVCLKKEDRGKIMTWEA